MIGKRDMRKILVSGVVAGLALVGSVGMAHVSANNMMSNSVRLRPLNGSGVTGTVQLTYNGTMTTAVMTVRHLKPMSVHPAHIHVGSCTKMGPVVFSFKPLVADMNGMAVSTVRFHGNYEHKHYYANVHMGPTLATKMAFTPITCGNIM